MNKFLLPASGDKYYGTVAMIKRLLTEEGVRYWKRYLGVFLMMAAVAGATAAIPYILGKVINQAYTDRDMDGVVYGAIAIFGLFLIRGFATYVQGSHSSALPTASSFSTSGASSTSCSMKA